MAYSYEHEWGGGILQTCITVSDGNCKRFTLTWAALVVYISTFLSTKLSSIVPMFMLLVIGGIGGKLGIQGHIISDYGKREE